MVDKSYTVLGIPSDEHYPDIVAAGSLANAVSKALAQGGSPLRSKQSGSVTEPGYARIEGGSRFSQMYTARDARMFLLDFWADNVCLASYHTPALSDVVAVLTSWLTDGLTPSNLAARHPAISLSHKALSYGRGTLIPDAWENLLRSPLDERFYGDLQRFIAVASERAELRAMLPYMTLYRFSVSPTHYPYMQPAWPVVQAVEWGRFAVKRGQFAVTDYRGTTLFGLGDAQQTVVLFSAEIARAVVTIGPKTSNASSF